MSNIIEGLAETRAELIKAINEPFTLDTVKKKFKEWLEIEDGELIDIVLAIGCERMLPGDPVWMFLVAPSGGTKTEMLRSLQGDNFYQLDNLTDHTLISGKIEKDETGKMVPIKGVLADMNGRVTILKDFTTLLQKPNEERDAIFAQFRAAYDGYLDFGYGTMKEKIRVNARFGLVAGVTPIIEIYQKLYALLGERFLTVRHHPNSKTTSVKAIRNLGQEEQMRRELAAIVKEYLETVKTENFDGKITEENINKIADVADAVAKMRAPVIIKTWNYIIQEARIPTIETPTRLSKQLCKIAQLLALIRGHNKIEDADIETMQRIARDCCIPNRLKILRDCCIPNRLKILKAFNKQQDSNLSTRDVTKQSGIPLSTCWRELKEMELLNLIQYTESQSDPDAFGRTKHTPDNDGWQIQDQILFSLLPTGDPVSKTTPPKEPKKINNNASVGVVSETPPSLGTVCPTCNFITANPGDLKLHIAAMHHV